MDKAEVWALLWSKKSNCFHVEPLARTAASGMVFFRTNATNDYLLLACGSYEEVSAKADELRSICRERDEVRRLYEGSA